MDRADSRRLFAVTALGAAVLMLWAANHHQLMVKHGANLIDVRAVSAGESLEHAQAAQGAWAAWTAPPQLTSTQHANGSSGVAKQAASIVVAVTSAAGNIDRRRWLRNQFRRNVELLQHKDPAAARGVVLKFVVGNVGLSDEAHSWIAAEQQEHGDLLILDIIDVNVPDPPPDGVETATALKVAHSTAWAVQHYDFPWFVRLGDDAYFRVDHFLLNVAPTLSRNGLMFGYAEDPGLHYSFPHGVTITRYCSGMGFIMTHDVAKFISDNALHLYKGYPEDAVVGLWLAGTNFKVQHDARLHDWEWRRCSEQSIIIHKHDYGAVDDDGVMRSCFPYSTQPQMAVT